MANWIDRLLRATSESEAPERYFYWAGLASLSAVLRRNVYLDRYYYKLYPNIYVIILGKSGLRKGVPVNLARTMVDKTTCTRVISGRNSFQAIVRDLGTAYSLEGGGQIKDSVGFLVSGELGSFLVKDPDALTVLTDLYDTHFHPTWKNTLKHSGVDSLVNVCITMLGASNEVNLRDVVSAKDTEGGFIARTFVVYEENKRSVNPLRYRPKYIDEISNLHDYLGEVSKLRGEFKLTNPAWDIYEKWYKSFSKAAKTSQDRTGTVERIHDNILKVACLLSVSGDSSMKVEVQHVEEAIERSLECYSGSKRVSMGAGQSQMARQTALVIQELLRRPEYKITRMKLLQTLWGEVDAIDLDRVLQTLADANVVSAARVGQNIVYTLSSKAAEMYTRFKKEETDAD